MMIYTRFEEIPLEEVTGWPYSPEYIRYMMEGMERGITNVHSKVEVLLLDGLIIPYSVKTGYKKDSWIHTFSTQYIDEMVSEVSRMDMSDIEQTAARQLLDAGRLVMDRTKEQTVTVFPSFMSTTLYHDYVSEIIEDVTRILVSRYRHHAIVFRTLNEQHDEKLIERLTDHGYRKLVSRAVYIYNPEDSHSKNERRDLKKDIKRYKKSGLKLVTHLEAHEFEQLIPLYEAVYLEKYSEYNPHYTAEFLKMIYEHEDLIWFVLKDEDRIVSFMGIRLVGNTLFPAYFGMDKDMKDLYFITSGLLYEFARENSYEVNNSAGAKDYKLARGSRPHMEYHLIYTNHLSLVQRMSYKLLTNIMTPLGTYLLKKLQFK